MQSWLLTMLLIVRAVQWGMAASAQQWLMACLASSREVHLRVHVSLCHHHVKWWGSTSSPGSARGRGGTGRATPPPLKQQLAPLIMWGGCRVPPRQGSGHEAVLQAAEQWDLGRRLSWPERCAAIC